MYSVILLQFSIAAAVNLPFKEKVRGVNLGGWLVAEPWITPSLFDQVDVPDEYSLGLKLGGRKASEYLRPHWETFFKEDDFRRLKSWGLNLLRIPIGTK